MIRTLLQGVVLFGLVLCFPCAAQAQEEASDKSAQLKIICVTEQSYVSVDEDLVGVCPVSMTLASGEHKIEVSKVGFLPQTQTIKLEAGVASQIQFGALIPEEVAPTQKEPLPKSGQTNQTAEQSGQMKVFVVRNPRKRRRLVFASVFGAAAVGLTALSISMVRSQNSELAAGRVSDETYSANIRVAENTAKTGLVFGGLSVLSLLAWSFTSKYRMVDAVRLSVLPHPQRPTVGLQVRF